MPIVHRPKLLLACVIACKAPTAVVREDAHPMTSALVVAPTASSSAPIEADATRTVTPPSTATDDRPPAPWELVYEGDIECDPSVGLNDVVVASAERSDWFVNVVPRHGEPVQWLGHKYEAVEGCDVAEDRDGIYVIHAGVLVPSGMWGTIRRYERKSGKMTVLYRPKVPLRGAVVDEGAVYTIRGDVSCAAVRVDAATGEERVILSVPRDEQGYALTVNRDSVFVATCRGGSASVRPTNDSKTDCEIRRAPKSDQDDAGATTVLRATMGVAMYMRADDTTLYFTDAANGTVGRISLDDGKTTVSREGRALRRASTWTTGTCSLRRAVSWRFASMARGRRRSSRARSASSPFVCRATRSSFARATRRRACSARRRRLCSQDDRQARTSWSTPTTV